MVTRSLNWREDRVFFHDCTGRLRSIPAAWTDVVGDDPFNVVAAGRAVLRTQELLDLIHLIESLRS